MKELVEEIMNHCDGIIERSERMTSGNYMHNCAANKVSAKIIKSCVNNLVSGIKWKKGKPKESGYYLVTLKGLQDSLFVTIFYYDCLKGWSHWIKEEITAYCKLSDIEPYKEKQP